MRPSQRTYSSKADAFERKARTVTADTKDLLSSITGSSYNQEEKLKLLNIVKKELKEAILKIN